MASYDAYGQIAEAIRSTTTGGVTTTDSYLYSLVGSGVNADQRASALFRRTIDGGTTWDELRRVLYGYYTGASGEFGELGDLMTLEEQVKNGSGTWVTLKTQYFRYYRVGG